MRIRTYREGDTIVADPEPSERYDTLTVARGERALILQVEGKGGAPRLTLADPKGRIYTPTTTVNKVVPDGNFVSAYLPGGNVTLLRVQHPRAGTWTLTPQAGYRAPGPPRPDRPRKLKTRRSHGTVTVRWPRLKGADGYVVRVKGNDGRKEVQFLSRRQRGVRILMVAPPARLKVRVAGWKGIRSIAGPARTGTVRPQKAKKKRKAKRRRS